METARSMQRGGVGWYPARASSTSTPGRCATGRSTARASTGFPLAATAREERTRLAGRARGTVSTQRCAAPRDRRPISAAARREALLAAPARMPPRSTGLAHAGLDLRAACESVCRSSTQTTGFSPDDFRPRSGRGMLSALSICPSGPSNSSGPRTSTTSGRSPRPPSRFASSHAGSALSQSRCSQSALHPQLRSSACFFSRSKGTISRVASCVAVSRTLGALPASNASSQRAAHRHQQSPGFSPGKPAAGKRCRQIVAGGARERQELGVDPGAYGMDADILGAGLAIAGAVEPGQRLGAAFRRAARRTRCAAVPPSTIWSSAYHLHSGRPCGEPGIQFQRLWIMIPGSPLRAPRNDNIAFVGRRSRRSA